MASKIEKSKLLRISTYAARNGYSTQWVYKLIKSGELKCEEIDGVKFVKLEK